MIAMEIGCSPAKTPIQESGDPMSALENISRITPFLWFDSNAEEAADFYISVFPNSRKLS